MKNTRILSIHSDDWELLREDVPELPPETGLTDLLVDGGYTHIEVEACCGDQGITQH
jgi:hypothetical protein